MWHSGVQVAEEQQRKKYGLSELIINQAKQKQESIDRGCRAETRSGRWVCWGLGVGCRPCGTGLPSPGLMLKTRRGDFWPAPCFPVSSPWICCQSKFCLLCLPFRALPSLKVAARALLPAQPSSPSVSRNAWWRDFTQLWLLRLIREHYELYSNETFQTTWSKVINFTHGNVLGTF